MINNEEQTTGESTRQRVSVLSMTDDEARSFFLESNSYCNFDLPPYFEFNQLLTKLDKCIRDNDQIYSKPNIPSKCTDINHTILNNKDGRLAWRPLQLIHPALYVSLVHKLTESSSWNIILKRFAFFHKNPKIRCLSIPVKSSSIQRNKAHQVLQWWEKVEQASIELSLEYEFLAHADIADCYSSIYTHSIP